RVVLTMASAPAPEATEDPDVSATGPVRSRDRFPVRQVRAVVGLWRRSLRFRVVVSTLVLGLLVVSIISLTMYRSIADGLVDDRVDHAQTEARAMTNEAETEFNSFTDPVDELPAHANDVVSKLEAPSDDDSHYVIFTRSLDNDSDVRLSTEKSQGVELDVVPNSLRQSVSQDPARQWTMTIDLERPSQDGGRPFPSLTESET